MQFIEFALDRYEKKTYKPWGIELKETAKIIGTVDFVSWNITHQFAEIGYVLFIYTGEKFRTY
ncbi:GNAT family N-acetyltransferase [Alkalihalobacterium elongatum]|uniref:GNAT family N-acetyltransferase n=1 Tax=Alkalihalobacterium elongatum TaxID=2675466 RepID=UPI001F3FD8A7|nr:hypothetical protein [Alkalihalobacterium elongatum]